MRSGLQAAQDVEKAAHSAFKLPCPASSMVAKTPSVARLVAPLPFAIRGLPPRRMSTYVALLMLGTVECRGPAFVIGFGTPVFGFCERL
jgi:hypothetical protein